MLQYASLCFPYFHFSLFTFKGSRSKSKLAMFTFFTSFFTMTLPYTPLPQVSLRPYQKQKSFSHLVILHPCHFYTWTFYMLEVSIELMLFLSCSTESSVSRCVRTAFFREDWLYQPRSISLPPSFTTASSIFSKKQLKSSKLQNSWNIYSIYA